MDAPKVQSIADAIYTAPRFDLRWHLENAIDRTWAQVIYMGLVCVERQLTLGGTLDVTADSDHIRITAASERAIPSVTQYCRCLWVCDGIPPPRNTHNSNL